MRWRRTTGEPGGPAEPPADVDPGQLAGVFATPVWLRGLGTTAWLLVGVGLLLVGLIWFLGQISSIVGPVVAAALVAAVTAPLATEGTTTIMLVLVLLAQGILQQIVQPIAFGATLDLNPLVVLIVTIAAGGLFGMAAAPESPDFARSP